MPIIPINSRQTSLPVLHRVRQLFPDDRLEPLEECLMRELSQPHVSRSLTPGSTAAILVGSRGIARQDEIVKYLTAFLKAAGVSPFIVPCMGSHGNGDADQQRRIVESRGITEASVKAPIRSSMQTLVAGYTKTDRLPVHVDRCAAEADFIIPVNRVKKHTDFDADIESGLCKMLTVGLGKHTGCTVYHRKGFSHFATLLPEAAQIVMDQFRVPFGIAIVENAHDNLHTVKAVPGSQLIAEEKKLLALSKSLMPYLRFDELDILIVREMGKDISGAGMDPSVTGRTTYGRSPFYKGPEIQRIIVNSLTEGSHGNAIGMGFADFITRELFDGIDFESTYANVVACANLDTGKIPIVLPDEQEALFTAIHSIQNADRDNPRIVRIQDTLHLTEIEVSESLLPYCKGHPGFELFP